MNVYSKFIKAVCCSLAIICSHQSFSQEVLEKITSIFEHEIGAGPEDTAHYHTKWVLAPIISYEPTTSLGLGVGTKFLFKLPKSYEETRTSNIPFAARYTLRNQFLFNSDFTVFSNQERWMYKGAFAFLKYPFSFYGIGNRTKEMDRTEISFNNILFEPLILKKIKGFLFMGGGLRINSIHNTHQLVHENGENIKIPLQDSLGFTSFGVELAVSIDSRDNVLNASEGHFLEYTLGTYNTDFGSSHSFNLSKLDFRKYFLAWESRPDVIAIEFYSRFSWGDVPLLEYSRLGGQELLRGMPEGRYRDFNALYFQTEYRWQAFERIGFVFYGGVGDVYDRLNDIQLNYLKYNVGTGLRLKIVKAENLNIRFDYGMAFGDGFDHNVYLNIAEAF